MRKSKTTYIIVLIISFLLLLSGCDNRSEEDKIADVMENYLNDAYDVKKDTSIYFEDKSFSAEMAYINFISSFSDDPNIRLGYDKNDLFVYGNEASWVFTLSTRREKNIAQIEIIFKKIKGKWVISSWSEY